MNMIDKLGLAKNKRGQQEFLRAKVLKSVDGAIREIEFNYTVNGSTNYTATLSVLPGMEFTQPTMTIRTTRIDIPFVSGDTVVIDGNNWTVSDVSYERQNNRAYLTNDSRAAYVLSLIGGKGSD